MILSGMGPFGTYLPDGFMLVHIFQNTDLQHARYLLLFFWSYFLFILDTIDSPRSEKSSNLSVQENFLKYLTEPNPEKLQELIENENKLNINHIYTDVEDYNAFQIICLKINNTFDLEDFPEKRSKFIDCIRLLLENGINLLYKEPEHYFEALDFSMLTHDKEIIELTIDQYKRQNISIANKDVLTTLLNIYEEIIKQDSIFNYWSDSEDSDYYYTDDEYESDIKSDGVNSDIGSLSDTAG